MRRLARRLFTLCSAISLVLCLAIGALWFASETAVVLRWNLTWTAPNGAQWDLVASSRYLQVTHVDEGPLPAGVVFVSMSQGSTRGNRTSQPVPGVVIGHRPAPVRMPDGTFGWHPWVTEYAVRYPLPFALTAILPAVHALRWWWRYRTRQRHPGLCPSCGYDLRASPGRCPECGKPPAKETSPAAPPG